MLEIREMDKCFTTTSTIHDITQVVLRKRKGNRFPRAVYVTSDLADGRQDMFLEINIYKIDFQSLYLTMN